MLDVLNIIGTIFVLIALGWGLAAARVFRREDLLAMGRFVVQIALPALILRAMSERDLHEVLAPSYMAAYCLGGLGVIAAGYALSRLVLRRGPMAATFHAMGMSCPNSGFVGYPVMVMVLPALAPQVLAMNMVVENIVFIPLLLALAERAAGTASGGRLVRDTALRLARTPLMVALVVGVVLSLTGLALPQVLAAPVKLLSTASAPLALVAIGGTLYGLSLRAVDLGVAAVVAGKLFVMPLLVLGALALVQALGLPPLSPDLTRALTLSAAMPAITIYPLLAQRHGRGDDAALALLVMTLLSFFTLTALLLLT